MPPRKNLTMEKEAAEQLKAKLATLSEQDQEFLAEIEDQRVVSQGDYWQTAYRIAEESPKADFDYLGMLTYFMSRHRNAMEGNDSALAFSTMCSYKSAAKSILFVQNRPLNLAEDEHLNTVIKGIAEKQSKAQLKGDLTLRKPRGDIDTEKMLQLANYCKSIGQEDDARCVIVMSGTRSRKQDVVDLAMDRVDLENRVVYCYPKTGALKIVQEGGLPSHLICTGIAYEVLCQEMERLKQIEATPETLLFPNYSEVRMKEHLRQVARMYKWSEDKEWVFYGLRHGMQTEKVGESIIKAQMKALKEGMSEYRWSSLSSARRYGAQLRAEKFRSRDKLRHEA